MRLDEQFIRHTISNVSIHGTLPNNPLFVVDSRLIKPNNIFVALPGQHQDGHLFVGDAFKNGAAGALIAAEKKDACLKNVSHEVLRSKALLVVPDPFEALKLLAAAWRKLFNYPVVGITGSVGKTFAKEMVATMFRCAGKSYIASCGNQNSQLGVPLNILRMRNTHEVAVFELGINRRGEMASLVKMVRPTIAVVTGIGHSHMEGLGSLQDIASEKREIFRYFTERDIGIVNGDQPLLAHVSFNHPVIKFGCKMTNQIQARKIRVVDTHTESVLKIYKNKYDVLLPKPHAGAVNSALVAAAVGHVLNIPYDKIVEAIQQPVTIEGCFETRTMCLGKGTMINDCYNANPESMKAALLAFQQIETSACKVAVLGDMLELGINSPFWHRQIGRFLRKVPSLKKVLLVGNLVKWIEKSLPVGVQAVSVATWQEARDQLPKVIGDCEAMILVKGSNGVGLSNLVKHYTE